MQKSDDKIQLTDNGIIDEYWSRNQNAVKHTAAKYGKFIFTVCFNILRQKQNSEECENDTYLKAWNSIPPEMPKCLKAYLAYLARITALDCFRREKSRGRIGFGIMECLDDYGDFLSDGCSVSEKVEAKELAAVLNRFLSTLSDREQVCFVKRFYFADSVSDIVKETKIPRSTVYFILETVKQKFKQILIKEGYLQ